MDVVIRNPQTLTGAHVDTNQHLHTDSVQRSEADRAARLGWRFNINTGSITMGDALVTSVLYVKNTGDFPLIISALIYNLGVATDGVGGSTVDVLRNPTAGPIIDNTNNVLVGAGVEANMNFGSTNSMTGLFYKGATSETAFTDGSVTITTHINSGVGRHVIGLGAMVLPKGTSLGINYTAPGSTSAQIVQFAIACHIRTNKVAASETEG